MTDPPTKGLGDSIRAARERAGLSTQAAAQRARISPAYLNKLEGGRVTTPSPRVLHRLSGTVDVPYWTLMHLADYVPADDPDPGAAPEDGREPRGVDAGDGAATNERLLDLLEAVRDGVDELRAGQERLLAAARGG